MADMTTGKVIALIRALSTSSTSSATYTVTDALIVGAATTSGVRLDLESGTLAVREGDDSAYGDVKALSVVATGAGSAAAPALACSSNYGWYVAGGLMYAAANGGTTGIYFSASALNGGTVTLQAFKINITARTSDGTDNTDSRGLITNRGATGTVTRTLHNSSGYINWYKNVVSGQLLRLEPAAGKRFLRVSGTYEAADKYLELPYGASLLVAYDGTDFVCLSEGGTLAVEP